MLRSVKLKSSKRRSMEHKSPRSRSMKNRSQASSSLSPLLKGAENSLSRLLKPSDVRRVHRRMCPVVSNSETDLSKNVNNGDDYRKSKSIL